MRVIDINYYRGKKKSLKAEEPGVDMNTRLRTLLNEMIAISDKLAQLNIEGEGYLKALKTSNTSQDIVGALASLKQNGEMFNQLLDLHNVKEQQFDILQSLKLNK